MQIIKAENLSKEYTYYKKEKGIKGSLKNIFKKQQLTKEAVKNLNLTIEQGDIVGLVGLNGAGKTTTLKMFSGILRPSGGSIDILGFDPFKKKPEFLKKITMVMGNKSQLWWDIPAIDTFELNRQIFEVDKKDYEKIVNELTEILNVKDLLNVQVRRLSLGERMKMELIAALVHSPSVIFLDEPTIGMDIISQYSIRDFLKEYNRKYKSTIILTSHNFDDIVYLCNRLLIIDKGSIIYDDQFEHFIKTHSDKKIVSIKFAPGSTQISASLKKDGIQIIEENEDSLRLSISEKEIIALTNMLTSNFSKDLKDINIENLDIKEIIRNIYTK